MGLTKKRKKRETKRKKMGVVPDRVAGVSDQILVQIAEFVAGGHFVCA
jgi:hypothetical protein